MQLQRNIITAVASCDMQGYTCAHNCILESRWKFSTKHICILALSYFLVGHEFCNWFSNVSIYYIARPVAIYSYIIYNIIMTYVAYSDWLRNSLNTIVTVNITKQFITVIRYAKCTSYAQNGREWLSSSISSYNSKL